MSRDCDFNMPPGCFVRDIPGCGRDPEEHSPDCLKANRRLARAGEDTDCICHVRRLDQVETGTCEGCGNQFEVGELAVIAAIDPDLHWCEACRVVCKCGHINGVHATVVRAGLPVNGCDGNHGEIGECACRKFVAKVPATVVDRAKGIWLWESYRKQLEKERIHA